MALQGHGCFVPRRETGGRFFDPGYADIKLDMLGRLTDRMAFTADPLPERRARW
ncbi:MAG: hypothetical protein OXC31_29970 [Spirochaetaceae bacterium]|nr:hypothetical protein [Spirochaetaceae bacterium]